MDLSQEGFDRMFNEVFSRVEDPKIALFRVTYGSPDPSEQNKKYLRTLSENSLIPSCLH